MKTRKIVLIIVLLIVFLFIAIWGIREYVLWNDGKLQKDNPMSKEEVLELLKKGEKYPNYYISFADSNNAKYDIYVKDNVLVEYYNNEFLLREDYNNNEYIMISKATDKEVAGISHSLRKQEYQQAGMDYSIVNKLEYKYLGEKEVDGRQVIYIQLEDESAYTKFVIDKETGIIVNRIDLSKVFIFTAHKNETKRELKLDVVTDENVARPDLSRYEVVGELDLIPINKNVHPFSMIFFYEKLFLI